MRKQMDNLMRDAVEGNVSDKNVKNPFVFGFSVKTAKKYSSVQGCTAAANAKSRVKGFTFNTTSQKCTLYKSIRGERKNSSSVSGKKS